MPQKLPELLSPAGNYEKMQSAVRYGADAVYLSGQLFGLRSASENFTIDELEQGIAWAHQRNVKVYITLNSFFHDKDFEPFKDFMKELERVKADAVIASDLGVVSEVLKNTSLPVHLSTQASCNNVEAAKFWKSVGVSRIILGREVSIDDASRIKDAAQIEIETFIHGSMCVSFSGHCVISNFTQGRDSNRGGCSQSCRHVYKLSSNEQSKDYTGSFMSSKDLNGVALIPLFASRGIDSVKIEGRMRSALYAGLSTKVYREALDAYAKGLSVFESRLPEFEAELEKIPHRTYHTGSLLDPDHPDSIFEQDMGTRQEPLKVDPYVGMVKKIFPDGSALVQVKNPFQKGIKLEALQFRGPTESFEVQEILSITGQTLETAKSATWVKIPSAQPLQEGQLLRRPL